MADQAIAFHLAEPEAPLAGPAFRRLACEDLDGAAGADVELPRDYVVELLVVNHSDEDFRGNHAARAAIIQDLLSVRPEPVLLESLPHRLFALPAERRAVDEPAFEGSDFSTDLLEDVGDRHPRRNRMGVDDQVRDDALRGEGHVFLGRDESDHPFLPVAGGELVAELRNAKGAGPDLCGARAALALRQHDGVHPAALPVAHCDRGLPSLLRRQEVRLLLEEPRRARFPDQDLSALDEDLGRY